RGGQERRRARGRGEHDPQIADIGVRHVHHHFDGLDRKVRGHQERLGDAGRVVVGGGLAHRAGAGGVRRLGRGVPPALGQRAGGAGGGRGKPGGGGEGGAGGVDGPAGVGGIVLPGGAGEDVLDVAPRQVRVGLQDQGDHAGRLGRGGAGAAEGRGVPVGP